MTAGALDRRVQFRRATLSSGPFGQEETWADHGDPVWASMTPVSDAERLRGGEIAATLTARFRVRWSAWASGLTPKDQLTFEGVTFKIAGIKEIGRREFLEITAAGRSDT